MLRSNQEIAGSGDLHQEAGAEGAGWSNVETTMSGTTAGFVHGPWGNDVTEVTRSVVVPVGTAYCEVSWRSWITDSRDNEQDRLLLDGNLVWSKTASGNCAGGWEHGPSDWEA